MKKTKCILFIILLLTMLTSCRDASPTKDYSELNSVTDTLRISESNNTVGKSSISQISTNADTEKVITDIEGWNHPTKEILIGKPFYIYKLALENNTYPKFYVKYPDRSALNNSADIQSMLSRIAKANGFWDYELINEESSLTIKVVCNKKLKKVIQVAVNSSTYLSENTQSGIDVSNKKGYLDIPKIYKDYINKENSNRDDEGIVFYKVEDIDLDGSKETIIATGTLDEDPLWSCISQLYVLREKNGKIVQIDGDISGGYDIYEVKLIQLQNKPGKYIYCGLTNGSMRGFQVIGLSKNKLEKICYSASATGAGEDIIKDFNNDGKYDGYIQQRWSYDVLYFTLVRTYLLKKDAFILSSTDVDIPDYPLNVKDVIMQYLSLKVIDAEKSPEVDTRLAELCKTSEAREIEFLPDIWHYPVYNTILEMENGLKFDIKENKNTADVEVSFTNEDKKVYKNSFHLIKSNGKWHIDDIK